MTEEKSKTKFHVFPEKKEILWDLGYNDMYIKLGPDSARDLAARLLSAAAKAEGEIVHRIVLDIPAEP